MTRSRPKGRLLLSIYIMRAFGEFLYDKYDTFEVDDVLIIMEPVALSVVERHIMGVDNSDHVGMQKFRVTFKWPRSKNKAKANTYDEEVRYVLAHDSREARAHVEQFVRNRRNKKIGGVKSDVQADYLHKSNLSRNQMEIKTKAVENWNDFVKLCEFIVSKKLPNAVKYFDQNDLSIFINKYKRSADFMEELQKLSKPVQLLMKRIYLHVANSDLRQDNHEELNKTGKYSDAKLKDILHNKAKGLGKKFPVASLKPIEEEPGSLGTVQDVIRMGKSYGFTYKELKQAKAYADEQNIDPLYEEKLRAYKDIKNRIQYNNSKRIKQTNPFYKGKGFVGKNNGIWDQDQGSFDKWGGDAWMHELEPEYPWLRSLGGGNAYEGAFALMRDGLPKKMSPLELWTKALEYLIHWKRDSAPSHYQSDDEIPF